MVKRHHLLRDGMTEEYAWDVLYNGRTMSKEEKNELLPMGASTIGRHESSSFGMDPREVGGKNGTKDKVRTNGEECNKKQTNRAL
jgi:hypothetical protein